MKSCITALRNILLPTDFSGESVRAIQYGQALNRGYGSNVFVVHVMDLFPFALSSEPSAVSKISEIRTRAKAQMETFVSANHLTGDAFRAELVSGDVCNATNQFVREHDIDLIILGSHGDVGLNRMFQGSTSEEIFRTAQCPVMVVGPRAREHASRTLFTRIFFPTDLSFIANAAVRYLECLLRDFFPAKVTLAHFLEEEIQDIYQRHKKRRQLQESLISLIPDHMRSQIEDAVIENCSPLKGMLDIAEGFNADLLLLGVRSGGAFTTAATHGLLSLAYKIIAGAPCPIMTVRSA